MSGKRKLLVGLLIGILLVAPSLVVKEPTVPQSSPVASAAAPTTSAPPPPPGPDAGARARLEARRDALLPRFTFSGDRIRGGGWYEHKTWGPWWERSHLEAPVTAEGRIYLKSYFIGSEWIFHDRLVVRLGDRVIETAVVPSFSDENQRELRGTFVTETLHFTSASDGGLLARLAADTVSPALLRLEGGPRTQEYPLGRAQRRALAEAFELAGILRQLR